MDGRLRNITSPRIITGIAAAAASLIAAIVMTWPLAAGFGRLGRTTSGDGQLSIWNVAWVAHALTSKPLELWNANIFYPHEHTLAYSEANLVAGIAGIPAWILTANPYAAHNSAVIFAFATSALGAWLLVRKLTGSSEAAVVAGAMFAFMPYFFAHTAHIQLLVAGGIPLSLLLFHRLADAPSPKRGAALGLGLALQALACAYYGIFSGLIIGYAAIFVALWRGLWKTRQYWIALLIGAAVSALIVVPFFIPYLTIQEGGFRRSLAESARYSGNLSGYLASSAHAHRWLLDIAASFGRWSEVLFPGILVTVFALASLVLLVRRPAAAGAGDAMRRRETIVLYASIALITVWASLGPAAGLYSLLFHTIPLFSFLRAPSRLGTLVVLALAVLAGIVIAAVIERWRPARRRTAAAVLTVLTLAELSVVPFPWERAPVVPAPYSMLARLPVGPVAEFPFYGERVAFHLHAQYMLFSTFHWQPLLNGYSDHIPGDFRQDAFVLDSFPSQESFNVLRRRRVRYVAVHWDMYVSRRGEIQERLVPYARHLRPLAWDDRMTLYEVVSFP